MNEQEKKMVTEIREAYAPQSKESNAYDKLVALDRKVKLPAEIFAYAFGIAGALVLGFGMCLAMGVILASVHMAVGIGIGCAGIAMVAINYPVYRAILAKRKAKNASAILTLADQINT
ncbi:MAG: dihydropteridine reductase [Christensenellaceae bacterium]